MNIRLELTGTSPLLMKNPQMADPENDLVQEIARIVSKRKNMTEDDRRLKEHLQWMAALYIDNGRIVVPTANIRKCLIDSGRTARKGTTIAQAATFSTLSVPLAYEGSPDPKKLYEDTAFRHRAMVNSNPSSGKKSMVPSVRPKFPAWALTADIVLIESVLDPSDLRWFAERAGTSIGLGDNRMNGFGRFSAVVKEL